MNEAINENLFLSNQQFREMRLPPRKGKALQNWVLRRTGYVLGGDGPKGSGVFVETANGHIGMFTAAHVVIGSILTGEISVGVYENGRANVRQTGHVAGTIHVSATCDAALLFVPQTLRDRSFFARAEWDPTTAPSLAVKSKVVAAGLPGRWTRTDIERRVVAQSRVMLMWTEVLKAGETIDSRADRDLPDTLGGMSGGPLFTFDRDLVGIHASELLDDNDRVVGLRSTPRAHWSDLYGHAFDFESPHFRHERLSQIMLTLHGRFGPDNDSTPMEIGIAARTCDGVHMIRELTVINDEATRVFTIGVSCRIDGRFTPANVEAHAWRLLRHMNVYPR